MKIVLAGGGTGGHFYPLIAVAEAIEKVCNEKTLLEPELFYVGPEPFDKTSLQEHDITSFVNPAGKIRRYPSLLNIVGGFSTAIGIIKATRSLFSIYPDVVFSSGGYAAFPTLYAARLLKIPVVIYDADASPGRVSLWSSKFAKFIGVAHPMAADKFPKEVKNKIARVGHPIRSEIQGTAKEGGHEFLKLDPSVPTVFVLGGSQGARTINDAILNTLPDLVTRYNVVHQTGSQNLDEVSKIASVVLERSEYNQRYRPFGLLNTLAIRMAAGITSLVIARAGSGTIFEIASWGIPAILIPIPLDISHDQTDNAFTYSRSGAAIVIEQHNLTPHLLSAEIDRLMLDAPEREKMGIAAKSFARPDAARKIAEILLEIGVSHEPV